MARGRAWGIIVSFVLAAMAACDTDDGPGNGAGGGAGGEQAHAGTPSVEAGGSPNHSGGVGEHAGGGVDSSGQAGQADGGVGGVVSGGVGGSVGAQAGGGVGGQAGGSVGGQAGGGAGGQAGGGGASVGGSAIAGSPPMPLGCHDASGGYGGWYDQCSPLPSAGGAGVDAEFHRITLGTSQTAIAINDRGQMLITSGWNERASCQAWVVDGDSVIEVTTGASSCVRAVDMNEAGTVLASQGSVPFLWHAGVATPLAGVASGAPLALNDTEQVVLADSPVGPALWEAGTLAPLRTPADEALVPVAINEVGKIVGYSGEEDYGKTWLWEDGIVTALELDAVHALNDVGEIAGRKGLEVGVLSSGTFSPLPTDPGGLDPVDLQHTHINAMTDDAVLVGDMYGMGEPDLARPFRFAGGVLSYLAPQGSARDVNRQGEIVGRRATVRLGPVSCDCWTLGRFSASLWVQACPSACGAN